MRLDEENYLAHYGILRKSGRYPWGSGKTPLQRSKTFLDVIEQHRKVDGMTEAQIAKAYSIPEAKMTVADLRGLKSRAVTEVKLDQIRTAQRLRDKGMGNSEIARQMSTPEKPVNESTVRSLLEPGRQNKLDQLQSTAEMLRRQVAEKEFVDVGGNVSLNLPIGDNPNVHVGISADKFKTAVSILKEEGYNVHDVNIPQVGTGEMTKFLVLTKPGVTRKEAFANRYKIRQITEHTDDGGKTYVDTAFKPPLHIDPKRVAVRYKEQGGDDADGVIYVRPGKEDLSLGASRYAQVRIAVGGTHYLKGMAIYKDDLPEGVDLLFNTNKSSTGNKLDAMKPLKRDKETGEVDSDLPFGAVIKDRGQILDSHGNVTSAMNKINEEGDWNKWSRTLSRQVLSKQKPELAEAQLDLTYDRRREEFERIKAINNPLVKRKLLETFAESTDSAGVHLKAVNMPKQANKVILPSNHVKTNEVFAPTFRNGTRVVLVRYPHAGTFEMPELTVNNKSREVAKMFGGRRDVPDAIAIHPEVAKRLSGADFDGDAVVVIPNDRGKITHTPALKNLKDFDPQVYHVPYGPKTDKYPEGTPIITPSRKQLEMGNATNLISDMTIKGASADELSRAVRHSMVVIDSEKHNLDFRASERDHGILDLKRRYQGVHPRTGKPRGAATLITRATSEAHPFKRKAANVEPGLTRIGKFTVDKTTGKKVWVETGELKPDGMRARFKSQKLAETDDAFSLVSDDSGGRGTRMEQIYADHSNRLKSLANEVRKEWVDTELIPYSKSAKETYLDEVKSLDSKLARALKNSPRERQAQVVANQMVSLKRRANPSMQQDELKKIKGHALTEARLRTGAKKDRIEITDREWDAIQAGAISSSKLEKILNNTDMDAIRERATPHEKPVMTEAITSRAKGMLSLGYTLSEVSDQLDIPLSTLESGI